MRSPKQIFMASVHGGDFKRIVASEAFEPACQAALMQLQSQLPPTAVPGHLTDPYIAIDANSQIWGAQRVLEILCNLHVPEKPESQKTERTLHYE